MTQSTTRPWYFSMQNVHRDGPPGPRRRPSAASPRIFGFPQAVFMIFASLGKSKSWNGVSHFFATHSSKVRIQLKIKVFYRCVPGYLFFGAFRETGPLYGQSCITGSHRGPELNHQYLREPGTQSTGWKSPCPGATLL